MTRVLFVSGLQIYPPLSGGNLRSFALANALGRHGFEVFVHSLVGRKPDYLARRPSGVQAWPEGIEEYVDRRPAGFLAQWGSYALKLPPLWITAYLRAAAHATREWLLPARLRERLAWCDVVVADFPFLHPIFRAPSARGRLHVLSTHNVEHHLVPAEDGWRSRRLRSVVRRLETRAARDCHILVSCCADDARFFEAQASAPQPVLVPNGVDLARFGGADFEEQRARTRRELGIADDERLFLFTGSKWGPNREAFDFLQRFAEAHARLLAEQKIHILAVGNVAEQPQRSPGFTATGRVERVEPYFAAADAAINPVLSGAGTNVKMAEFIALRLPVLTTTFGARGLDFRDGETGFLFVKESLAAVLARVRRLFDEDPDRLRRIAARAYARNEGVVDMNACVRPLVEAIDDARRRGPRPRGGTASSLRLRGHLPALDGVRGLAILAVLLFHFVAQTTATNRFEAAANGVLSYGLLGVDLFFVLSGFLITGILYDSRADAGYFRSFYMRRVLRIFPLYYGVLAVVFFVLPLVPALRGSEIAGLRAHQAWAWLYGVNVYLALQGGWVLSYLEHLWSLAVEEHFYFVWPLVVWALAARPRALMRTALALAVLSFGARAAASLSGVSPIATTVLTPFQLDALCLGAFFAVALRQPGGEAAVKRTVLPMAVLAGALLAGEFAVHRFTDFGLAPARAVRGGLFRVLCAALLLYALFAPAASWAGRVFGGRALGALGKYSYGLYVYHHFLSYYFVSQGTEFALAGAVGSHTLAVALQAAGGMAASLAVAWLSYELFEKHFLQLKRFWRTNGPANEWSRQSTVDSTAAVWAARVGGQ